MRVALPNNGYAELHEKITTRGKRVLTPIFQDFLLALVARFPQYSDFSKLDLSDEVTARQIFGAADGKLLAAAMDFQAAANVAFVKSWSLGAPPTMDTIWDLPDPAVFDELSIHTSPLAVAAMADQRFGPSGKDDPESPTGPSAASQRGGGEETTTQSTNPTDEP
jgi:hypothetical protein